MDDPDKYIENSERLTGIFGYWPTFHDAEVIEFSLWRGDVEPSVGRFVFPVVTTKIHLWELTSEVDARGYYVTRHHTFATLRFHHVEELRLEEFNHQNAIFRLGILPQAPEEGSPLAFRIDFEPAHGISAQFRCARVEVVHVEPSPPFERST